MLKQRGTSLIEFLISSAISVVIIGMVIGMLTHHNRVSVRRANELMLVQNTNSVLQTMKQDLHRAGYNGSFSTRAILSGATQTYHVRVDNQTSLIAYAYLSGEVGTEQAYTNVVYQRETQSPDLLKVCEKKLPYVMSVNEAENFNVHFGNTCNTLFDRRRIVVASFALDVERLSGLSLSSALVTITLSTTLSTQPQVTQSLSFTIKQRNW